MKKQLYFVKKKYLAEALSFLGYNYQKINDDYAFVNTDEFSRAMTELLKVKKQFGKSNDEKLQENM